MIRILQLYPEELGVAGDRGNIMALSARLERAGVEATVTEHRRGDTMPHDADLVVIGGGPLSAMRTIHDDLTANRDTLTGLFDADVPFFAYGAGAELLSHELRLLDGTSIPGLELFPFTAIRGKDRQVAYVVADTTVGRVVGFEDHASRWQLDAGATPFGRLVFGGGNGDGVSEGVIVGSSVATQIGGPALPLNPALTDALLSAATSRRGISYLPGEQHATLDHYAKEARAVIEKNAEYRFTSI